MVSHALIPVLECNLDTPEFCIALPAEAVHILTLLGLTEDNLKVILPLNKLLGCESTKLWREAYKDSCVIHVSECYCGVLLTCAAVGAITNSDSLGAKLFSKSYQRPAVLD